MYPPRQTPYPVEVQSAVMMEAVGQTITTVVVMATEVVIIIKTSPSKMTHPPPTRPPNKAPPVTRPPNLVHHLRPKLQFSLRIQHKSPVVPSVRYPPQSSLASWLTSPTTRSQHWPPHPPYVIPEPQTRASPPKTINTYFMFEFAASQGIVTPHISNHSNQSDISYLGSTCQVMMSPVTYLQFKKCVCPLSSHFHRPKSPYPILVSQNMALQIPSSGRRFTSLHTLRSQASSS
jgi:hypothetical protein